LKGPRNELNSAFLLLWISVLSCVHTQHSTTTAEPSGIRLNDIHSQLNATTHAAVPEPKSIEDNDDPRKYGLVASLNQPGGNVTGVSWFSAELGPKRLTLLHDLVPNAKIVALLLNPNNAETARQPAELQEAARALHLQIVILNATTPDEIDSAFATISQNRIGALVVAADSFLANRREQIIALAARHAVPAIYVNREMAGAGGPMSYGTALPMRIAGPGFIPREFSRARNALDCRSIRQPNSN
jgi:hypothetical protein